MKKKTLLYVAVIAALFIGHTGWGQVLGNGLYNLSGTASGTAFDYYAGTSPKGYFDKSVTVIGIDYQAYEPFPIDRPGGYVVSGTIC